VPTSAAQRREDETHKQRAGPSNRDNTGPRPSIHHINSSPAGHFTQKTALFAAEYSPNQQQLQNSMANASTTRKCKRQRKPGSSNAQARFKANSTHCLTGRTGLRDTALTICAGNACRIERALVARRAAGRVGTIRHQERQCRARRTVDRVAPTHVLRRTIAALIAIVAFRALTIARVRGAATQSVVS
jgi:hypothetical protein